MPRGKYQHPSWVRRGDRCFRCDLADVRRLFAVSIVRYYSKADGRRSGRSLGPARICRPCAEELLAAKARQPGRHPDSAGKRVVSGTG